MTYVLFKICQNNFISFPQLDHASWGPKMLYFASHQPSAAGSMFSLFLQAESNNARQSQKDGVLTKDLVCDLCEEATLQSQAREKQSAKAFHVHKSCQG